MLSLLFHLCDSKYRLPWMKVKSISSSASSTVEEARDIYITSLRHPISNRISQSSIFESKCFLATGSNNTVEIYKIDINSKIDFRSETRFYFKDVLIVLHDRLFQLTLQPSLLLSCRRFPSRSTFFSMCCCMAHCSQRRPA